RYPKESAKTYLFMSFRVIYAQLGGSCHPKGLPNNLRAGSYNALALAIPRKTRHQTKAQLS
ncbi:hypothetical protein WG66_007287, partial [Moniliophthora roreri]